MVTVTVTSDCKPATPVALTDVGLSTGVPTTQAWRVTVKLPAATCVAPCRTDSGCGPSDHLTVAGTITERLRPVAGNARVVGLTPSAATTRS